MISHSIVHHGFCFLHTNLSAPIIIGLSRCARNACAALAILFAAVLFALPQTVLAGDSHTFPTFSTGAFSGGVAAPYTKSLDVSGLSTSEFLMYSVSANFTAGAAPNDAYSSEISMELNNGSTTVFKVATPANTGGAGNSTSTTLCWTGVLSRTYAGGGNLTIKFFDTTGSTYIATLSNVIVTIYPAPLPTKTFATFNTGTITGGGAAYTKSLDVTGLPTSEFLIYSVTADFVPAGGAYSGTMQMELNNGGATAFKAASSADTGASSTAAASTTLRWTGVLPRSYPGGGNLTIKFNDSFTDAGGPYTSTLSNVVVSIYPAPLPTKTFATFNTTTITGGAASYTKPLDVTGLPTTEYLLYSVTADYAPGASPNDAWSSTMLMELNNGGASIFKVASAANTGTLPGAGGSTLRWNGVLSRTYTGGGNLTIKFTDTFTDASGPYTSTLNNVVVTIYPAEAITNTISGNAGVGGATLSYTDGTAKTATADGTGAYAFPISYNWSGTVTPSKTGSTFTPVNRTYTNVTANQTAQDYITSPTVTTQATSAIAATTATGNGNITVTGGANATARGVVFWAYNNTDQAIGDGGVTNVAESGGFGVGAFTASLTPLSVNTQYNARAYATSPNGTGYGTRVAFWTLSSVPSAPTVNTPTATTLNVAVNTNGNPTTTAFCIQETSTGNYVQVDGSLGAGQVWQTATTWGTKTVTGLTTGSTYTFQVKSRNGAATETAFGATASGVPVSAPTVTTPAASGVTATTATGNGTITATYGTNATARGVIFWAYTGTDQAIGDSGVTNVAESGSFGTGAFTASLTSLSVNTQYNARAYATSPDGTGYGASVVLWTLSSVPSALTVNTPTATTLDVAVNANGNPTATEFCIQETSTGNYVQVGGSLGAGQVWQSAATWGTKTVTGLTTGSTYTFQVKARNGAATETGYGTTASGMPVSAPTVTSLAATSVSTTGATFNGTVNANGADATVTFDYGLTNSYGTNLGATPGTVLAGAGSTAVAATLSGLSSNTVYHFRAKGTNSVGTTNGNDLTFTTVPGLPTVVTATADDTQAFVTFTAPTGGATITSYTVTSSPGSLSATGSASPILVTGLTNGTAYTFTVTATNASGTGSPSAASASVTPKTAQTITFAPGAQNFGTTPTLTATASSTLAVTFTSDDTSVATITTGGTLTFLTTGTASITAHQVGDSTYLAAPDVTRTFTVNAVVPGAPTIGTSTAGDAQASISFTAPAFTGGATITGYTVTSNPGGLTKTGSASPITVTGLTNGTAYTFTVTATNNAGTGAASTASNSVTPAAIVISPATLPDAVLGVAYSQTFNVSGGTAPYTYGATGTLPTGLTLSSAGALSGTPTALGTFPFTVTATDANSTAKAIACTITVRAKPVVTISGGATAFTEGDNVTSTPVVIDGALTVTDADSATLASGTVSITGNFQTAEDVLAFTNDGSTMGNIAGSYDSTTGVLTLTSAGSAATLAQWQAALRSVTYTNLTEAPNSADRTISFVVNDGTYTSTVASEIITVAATDDTPTLIGLSNAAIVQSAGANAIVGTLTTTDIDSTTFTYTLVSGTGSTDNALFNLSGSTLRANNAATLSVGSHSVRIQSDDGAGGLYAQSFTITVGDDVAPAASVITTASGLTSNATPTLTGTAEALSTVSVYGGATLLGSTIASSAGAWSFTPGTALADGAHTLTARATDTTGNTSAVSNAITLTIDTMAPVAPVITTISGLTNDATPTIIGTAEALSTVRVYDGATLQGSTTASAAGAWSYTPDTVLTDGAHVITATAIDAAGNTSPASATITLTIDTTMPPPVFFTTTTGVLSNNIPTVQGTAEPNATVRLNGNSMTYTLTANSSGLWAWTAPSVLAEGVYGFTAFATDAAGNDGPIGLGILITVDTIAPDTTITGQPAVTSNSSTATFTFLGSDGSGSGVASYQASLDGGAYAPATSPKNYTALADGSHIFRVRTVDRAGNTDATPASYTWIIDTIIPPAPPPPTTPVSTTNNTKPMLTGTAEAGSTVIIYDGGTLVGMTTANSSGAWTYTFSTALTVGSHMITTTVTDAAGNISPASTAITLTIDATAPAAPVITTASGLTNNVTPTLIGTAEALATVKVYDGTTLLGSTTASAAGTWSYTPGTALTDGAHAITAAAIDAANNTSPASTAITLTIDTIAPATPVITTPSGLTTNHQPTVQGTAEAGSTLTLSYNSTTTTIVTNSVGNWTWTPTTPLADGNYSFTATATDTAGNTSASSSACLLSIGTAPSVSSPVARTVAAGASALLTVTATGTATLGFQWQRSADNSTFADITGANSATHTIASTTVTNTGSYRVVVTNAFGTATSTAALLTVTPTFTAARPDGYATTTTGGNAGTSVVVTTAVDFRTLATSTTACTITVVGQLSIGTVNVASNKTIQGADADATLIGTLSLSSGVSNVIIRGLNLTNPGTTIVNGAYTDGGDALTISGASKVFVTHCTFFDCADHDIKITTGADNVTISWCEFYASASTLLHRHGVQIGNTSESQPLHVTLHHNGWTSNLDQRMPFSSHGYVHLYNNYVNATGNTSGSVASDQAQFLSERNVYASVASPLTKTATGKIRAIGNVYTTCTGTEPDGGTDTVFTPAYSYEMLPTSDVATEVTNLAGNTAGAGSTDAATGTATITGPTAALTQGNALTLTAVPTGFSASTYQWRLNNADIAGATAATYTHSDMQVGNAGVYTVAVAMATGDTVVSTPFTVMFGEAPQFPKMKLSPVPGGGGAPGLAYLAALALLGSLRFLRRYFR